MYDTQSRQILRAILPPLSFILTGLALIMIIRVGGPRLVLALAVPLAMAIMIAMAVVLGATMRNREKAKRKRHEDVIYVPGDDGELVEMVVDDHEDDRREVMRRR
jgi:hypothetical protein